MRKLLCIMVALLWSSTSFAQAVLDSVQFLDYSAKTGNYIFRGDLPDYQNADGKTYTFDMTTLKEKLANAKLSNGTPALPSQYFLVDISLLDPALNPNDARNDLAEVQYFVHNPTEGKFIAWPLLGSYVPPVSVSKTVKIKHIPITKTLEIPNTPWYAQGKFSSTFNYDNLYKRAVALHKMLNTKYKDMPVVFYIHCHSGCDRTGMMATAYSIIAAKTLPSLKTLIDGYWPIQNGTAYRNDQSDYDRGCGRDPNYWATSQILWLCYYKVGEIDGYQNWADNADQINSDYKRYCLTPIKQNSINSTGNFFASLQKLPTDGMDKNATGLPFITQLNSN
ncbi:hypothetical protein [Vibrio marisflavi]|uniref:Tyrosine specific protein phosphatases domain-containing protein n=1 Tax=Vibrio marisflavi CECT 7928 TaxID=634439 RepID=A0ABM8ZZ03_9VIBR|nr:hypothetical protein [Vibrio marisflavi]CAH0536255.1 hypothetical protein VMF7928_00297 [Vibrio marisflavi CECT 7928]